MERSKDMGINLLTIRMFVHVLAATVWVGGQLVLGGLIGVVREQAGSPGTKAVARRFALLSWPAFAVSTFTGIWNVLELNISEYPESYKAVFGAKMTCFIVTGAGAALHVLVPAKWAKAIGGAAASLGAIGVLFFAVALKYADHS
jgi:putative copper export protein